MKYKFDISRQQIFDLVSALTSQIAQQNGVDFDSLWASPSDYEKLDVYYHEAITNLEVALARQVSPSAKFVPLAEGEDYSLTVDLNHRWAKRLKPLVVNRLQEYLVHRILHSWISGFKIELATIDYSALAVADLPVIVDLLQRISFEQDGDARTEDSISLIGDDDDNMAALSTKPAARNRDMASVKTDYKQNTFEYERQRHTPLIQPGRGL